jgi:hypothetical protein
MGWRTLPKEPLAELGPGETLNGAVARLIFADPSGSEPPDAEDRKIEQGNPGEQTQGQPQSETPPTAGAGDRITLSRASRRYVFSFAWNEQCRFPF